MKTEAVYLDPAKPFQFLHVNDHGSVHDGDGTCCPHCGAECRYVYVWAEFGKMRSAAAGCYAALTGHLKKDDYEDFMVKLSLAQAKNKPLNGWQKTVVRMLEYIQQGKYSEQWCNEKIWDAIREQKRFAAKKWGGR